MATIGLFFVLLQTMSIRPPAYGHYHSAAGYFLIMPLLLGLAIWRTASTLTHHSPHFRPSVFWMALFGLSGGALFLSGFTMAAAACVFAIAIVSAASQLFCAWKARLIRRRCRTYDRD